MRSDSKAERVSVFIVDDEPIVLKAVAQSVASLPCQVTTFASSPACLEAVKEIGCDLVISDINMPELNGIQLLSSIKKASPQTGVVLITGYGDIPMAVEAVRIGAIDFLEKPLDESTFLPKIQAIFEKIKGRTALPLTDSEKRILRLIAAGKSNKEIAYLLNRSIRTIENHRHRMMEKLNAKSPADLTKIAIQHGLASIEG